MKLFTLTIKAPKIRKSGSRGTVKMKSAKDYRRKPKHPKGSEE